MIRQQMTRWLILGAIAVALALPALDAKAEPIVVRLPDFGSALEFQAWCEAGGGVLIDTWDGNLWCHFPNGTQVVCDITGHDCHKITDTDWVRPAPPPTGPELGIEPSAQGPATDPAPAAPEIDPSDSTDVDQHQTVSPGKGKKGQHSRDGKKGKHSKDGKKGKHRKR